MVCNYANNWGNCGFDYVVNIVKICRLIHATLLLGATFGASPAFVADADLDALQYKPRKCRPCSTKPNLFTKTYNFLHTIYTEGKNELYVPAYAWHNRFLYDSNRIGRYNENPWGGGLGKSYYDEKGDWHGLYAFAFLDSHKYPEPILGYAFLKILSLPRETKLGGGYAVLLTQRPDINNGIPFPGALPWVSVSHKRVSVVATYIPGGRNIGNVLFLIGKVLLG